MDKAQNALTPTSLSEQVYLSLKKQILKGDLPPGHRLIVMDIAKIYDISQAPVREALERLKQEGLIVGKTNKGSVVAEITHKEIRDIYELRQLIEGYALRETMKVMTPQDIEFLEQILRDMKTAVDENDSYRLVELDMQFHGHFYKRSGNDLFLGIWDGIKTKIMRFISVTNQDHSGYSIPNSHAELLGIIKSGNIDEAEHKLIRGLDFYKRYTN
ncbi:GntR family transcriptional regulator [Gordoniibacillus kamchatkensis]|uniref:GntR family transcriptional regulator n=1 Tax=Gordoniibacillus kamchatkensis TaxID=1590651 RepID=A0ABR5AHK4_9BACL|nr:GntR family transcriptional regulator [Paenibacillus sp. VKM B-2647]KIL40509.1 GntR family transcriptional regulator [Paenibacillus sp. VKM B-2647]